MKTSISDPNVHYKVENNRNVLVRRELRRFSLSELKKLPTLSQGHFDDLKYKDKDFQLWLSRMTVGDGMPYNNQVTVEIWNTKTARWETCDEYQAK